MWKNIDTSDVTFNSFDIHIDKLNTDNDSSLFFSSDDHSNSAKNFPCIDSNQNSFSNIDTSVFGDDPLGFRKEESNKSIFTNQEFDLINSIKDNNNRLNEFIPNLNNNNNNSCFQNVPLKTSKRGRGRGSRGSYKPRGSHRSRTINQSSNYVPCSYNNSMPNCVYSYGNKFNPNNSGAFISQSPVSNSHQTVCINPEILRRLGYQQQTNSNDNNSSLMLNMKNQCIQSNNSIDDYSYLWNNQFNDTNKPNSHIYDNSCLNNNETNFEDSFSSNYAASSIANDLSFDLFKSNFEETNYFEDLDSKCYLDISNKEHLILNAEDYENSNLTDDSNLDNFF